MASQIEHSGVVERSEGGVVFVKITSQSACGTCKSREACGLAEAQDKIVAVPASDAGAYAPGQAVTVGIREGAGRMAVLLAYVAALGVLLAVLVALVVGLEWAEGPAALAALAAVVVYYGVLWLFRAKLETKIKFTITKNY